MRAKPDTYLGDGVYAGFDGFQVWLSTQDGSEIALEPEVFKAVIDYGIKVYSKTVGVPVNED